MVIRCQFSLVFLLVGRYTRRKPEEEREIQFESGSFGLELCLEKGVNTP